MTGARYANEPQLTHREYEAHNYRGTVLTITGSSHILWVYRKNKKRGRFKKGRKSVVVFEFPQLASVSHKVVSAIFYYVVLKYKVTL